MKTRALWFCVLVATAVAMGQTADSREAPGGTTAPADTLSEARPPVAQAPHASENELPAAGSLRHSAVCLIHSPPDTPARAGRLVVLLRYAARLDPRDGETCRLLAGVYESRNQPALAAQTLENCRGVLERPCYDANCRLLALLLDQRERTEDRITLLEEVLRDDELPPSIRAVAAVHMARLHRGRGDLAEARDTYSRALELDPTDPDAAEGLLRVTEDPTAADEAAALLRLLAGNPKAVAVAWDVASLVDSLGLHERSLTFFDHAMRTAVAAGGEDALSAEFVTEYCNAMLNAEDHGRAVELFDPMLDRFDDNADLLALLVEAHRAVGQTDRADEMVASLRQLYADQSDQEELSAMLTAQLAWFLLITADQPQEALNRAAEALQQAGDDNFVRRVHAACLVRTGQPEQARQTLEELQDRDVYATVFLAEALFALGEPDAAADALRSVVGRSRSGPAYRQARELAERHDIALPAAEDADAVAEAIDGFDTGVLEMGHSPQQFVSVELTPQAGEVHVGEPIVLEAKLSNIGRRDVTIGDWGLLTPTMSFEVETDSQQFTNLPVLSWPAPRHLKSGESITTTVRLDVGELWERLARRHMEELTLTVRPTLDPIETADGTIQSALPQVKVEPVTVVRSPLAADARTDPADELAAQFAQGSIEQRMLAARRVGTLLAAGAEAQPAGDRLLALLEQALADESPAVRSEMLKTLQLLPLNESILRAVAPVINDPSPLVRMRAAELLGTDDPRQHQPVLRFMARDENELVRGMAELFTTEQN
ncbi:MAG: tetratricopeptide repeat protein [Phycisphaerae bacterium]